MRTYVPVVACALFPRFELTVAAGDRAELLQTPTALAPEPGGIQQVGLPGAGPAAAHVDGDDSRRIEHDGGDARRRAGIVGMADPDAGDIGEEVAGWGRHGDFFFPY